MSTVTIRPATPADAAGVAAVWTESARAGFRDLLPPGHPFPTADGARFAAQLTEARVRVLVADEGGGLLGHTTFGTSRDADAAPEVGEVRSFFVSPAAWRRGVGSIMMAHALEGLAELGFGAATVWSFADNERANAFYERHGFTRDGTTRTEEVWAHLPEVRYRRTLR
jgi:ribosomal protein S18 acetylase RimI-like enzyme